MVTKFRDIFENYELYSDRDFLMTNVTPRLLSEVSKVLLSGLRKKASISKIKNKFELDNLLKNLCDIICEYTNREKTSNWGWYFLIEDYEAAFQGFLFEPLDKFMDAVGTIAVEFLNGSVIDDLNTVFSENNFGYRIRNNPKSPWVTVKPIDESFKGTHGELNLKNLCRQTEKYIYNQKIKLFKTEQNKERKDIIIDILDVYQKLLLKITNTEDLNNAIQFLKTENGVWGPQNIIDDGTTELFKLTNNFQFTDEMNEEQFVYYVDRMLIFVNYINRIVEKI